MKEYNLRLSLEDEEGVETAKGGGREDGEVIME